MGPATAQSTAAPKPSQSPPPPMPRPGRDNPLAAAMTVAELEAAVAALPGKRDALREAFNRLAVRSPSPLPFNWEDLDAHLSWLQSSISLRFRQLRALEAARPAPAAAAPAEARGVGTGDNLERQVLVEEEEEVMEVEAAAVEQEEEVVEGEAVELEQEKADEEMQESDDEDADDRIGKDGKYEKEARDEVLEEEEEEVEEVADDKIGNEIKDEKNAREEEEQDSDEEMQVARKEEQSIEDGKNASQDKDEEQSTEDVVKASQGKGKQSTKGAKKASQDEEDANMEEAATKKASAVQVKEQEACGEKQVEEEQEAHEEEQDAKNTTKEEEEEKTKKVSWDQGSQTRRGPGGFDDLAAACTSMDARRLVKLIHTNVGLSANFHAAMHRAPDGAALSLRVVELFLHDKILKTNKVWANCIGLIRTIPVVVTKLSTESIEQAKRLAKDWKEMIDNPGSCTTLGSQASWGLLNFLISYNIVSEFDMKEIFRIFGTIPRKHQRKNNSLFLKGLGLVDRIPELMDYLIENGQQMNVLYLAPFFNLVEKYPPLSLLKGYIEKAKQIVMEISQKNMTRQSLSAVIIKELDNLRMARDLAKQEITDSGLRTSIMAEIYALLGEFEKMKRSLADAPTALTSNPQQQQMVSNRKRKKEQAQEHHKGQENQQQGQQSKAGKTLEKKQNKPQQKQNKPQEKQQQNKHQHSKRPRQRAPKVPARASPAARDVPLRGHFGHPSYTAIHGIHHDYPAQPGWPGAHCAPPFTPQLGAPENIGPFNLFYPRPEFYTQ